VTFLLPLVLGLMAGPAHAEQPLTYAEVLQGAVANNGLLKASEFARAQAAGQVLFAQGAFDPFYTLDGSLRRSRNLGFFQGFPFESTSRTWQIDQSIEGTARTGTGYNARLNIGRDLSDFTTDFGLGSETQRQDAFTATGTFTLSQQLLRGIRFQYNVQNVTLARAELTAAELAVESQRQEALFAAAQAYWNWVYQDALRAIAHDAVAVAQEALRVGELQVERGQLAPVEGTRLQAALVQAQQDALDAENLAEQAANLVLTTIGRNPGDHIMPATPPGDVPPTELDPVKAVEVALQQNLDLALARQQLDTAGITLANAKHGLLPTLVASGTAGVGSQRCPPGTDNEDCVVGNAFDAVGGLFAGDNQPFVQVGGVFSVPLGNRAARGSRDTAEGVVWQRGREVEDLQRTVAAQVEEQVRALQSARQRMELADTNTRLAQQTLEAEEALASAGRLIQKDVLEARTELARARAEAAKARTDYRLAQALLLKLQGQLTEQSP
jgi:outer membrane protein TolC